jgi:hypothetical protein
LTWQAVGRIFGASARGAEAPAAIHEPKEVVLKHFMPDSEIFLI